MGNIGKILTYIIYALVVNINRVIVFLTRNTALHRARFARIHELSGLITNSPGLETSLLLGLSHLNHTLHVKPTKARRELGNLLVVAPTRGGKGLLATAQLLTWPHSVIVNDIKGDLFSQTAGFRSSLGEVFVIDPQGYGNRYDPLNSRHTEDELLSSATHLLFKPDEGDGAIFTQRASVMLTQLFLAAREEGVAPLPYARLMIRAGLYKAANRLNEISPDLATQFLDVELKEANLSDRFLLSAWGTLSARIRPLLTETVVRTLAGTDFDPRHLMQKDKPVTIYLRWPERDLLTLSPLVRLLWGSLIDELISTYDAFPENCHPVLLLIDEAGRTAIPSLADHATTVVGRGISLWIAVQSLSQLDVVYGRSRSQVLRDNMESKIYYRPSNYETASYLERALGRHSEYAHSQTAREGTKLSQGLTEQAVPLMTSQEVSQMRDEDIIGFHRRLPAFRAKRMDWRRFPTLSQRQRIPPPTLSVLPQIVSSGWSAIPAYIDPDAIGTDPDEDRSN